MLVQNAEEAKKDRKARLQLAIQEGNLGHANVPDDNNKERKAQLLAAIESGNIGHSILDARPGSPVLDVADMDDQYWTNPTKTERAF